MLSKTIYSLQRSKIYFLTLLLSEKPLLKGLSLEDKCKSICFLCTELILQDHTKVVVTLSAKAYVHTADSQTLLSLARQGTP